MQAKKLKSVKQGVCIKDFEAREIKALESNLVAAKISLADAYANLETTSSHVRAVADKYINRIEAAALAHGIDLSNPEKDKWNFDLSTMTFTKQ